MGDQKGVGIIGCGAIGTSLAQAIDEGSVQKAGLVTLFDQYIDRAERLASRLRSKPTVAKSLEAFLAQEGLDIVVEAASQEAVKMYAKRIVAAGKSLMVMSVGALLDSRLYEEIMKQASQKGGLVCIPSGALAGLDGIRAASIAGLSYVRLRTRKNPEALADSPYFRKKGIRPDELKKPKVIYEGPAKAAVREFPTNVNVAAALGLAGIGGTRTIVQVVADPRIKSNVHEVYARGAFGDMRVVMKNIPHPDNPRTSYLAVLSALEMLKSLCVKTVRLGT